VGFLENNGKKCFYIYDNFSVEFSLPDLIWEKITSQDIYYDSIIYLIVHHIRILLSFFFGLVQSRKLQVFYRLNNFTYTLSGIYHRIHVDPST